jgi:alkylation response protein AidB-like acyl-CoA dehydrogenase
MAQYADMCMLLVRTASEGPKQAGITFLLMDMKAKGVEVRPINQIQGDQEYCEIFLDEVEVPVAQRIGEENGGWAVTQATLSAERGLTLMELSYRMRGALHRIAGLIRSSGRAEDAGLLRDFGQLVVRCDSAAAIVKNTYSRVLREFSLFGLRLGGLEAQVRHPITYGDLNTDNWMADFMNSYAWTIAAGSEEVQRNIIAERMLGMQREPKGWTGA